jgi:hypothetical protein
MLPILGSVRELWTNYEKEYIPYFEKKNGVYTLFGYLETAACFKISRE